METSRKVSRRAAVAGIGAAGLGLAVAARPADAVEAEVPYQIMSLADHPLVGVWLVMVPTPTSPDTTFAVTSVYGADGSVIHSFPVTEAGPDGVRFRGAAIGTWEAVDERTGHFTTVQALSDADGAFIGTLTLDGHPTVSEDGQTFEDRGTANLVTIRDESDAIVAEIPGNPQPARGYRMSPGNPGFPDGPPQATPTG
jgi:hypothetical protein